MSTHTHLVDSEEEELGALIYKSSQTAKKFRDVPADPPDDSPASDRVNEDEAIHERSSRYSLRSASKKLKVDYAEYATGESSSEFEAAPKSDDEDNSVDECLVKPSSSLFIAQRIVSKRHNTRRAPPRQANKEGAEPKSEYISSTSSTTLQTLSSSYCTVIDKGEKSSKKEGTYTTNIGKNYVVKRFSGKKFEYYRKPVDSDDPRLWRPVCTYKCCTNNILHGRGTDSTFCIRHGGSKKKSARLMDARLVQ